MKLCTKCQAPIIRSPRANNVKYCTACRVEAYRYTEYRTAWQATERARQATSPQADKIQCYICKLYYKKPISHAWQVHGVHEREYKEALGLDHKKGIIKEEAKEVLREHIKDNYAVVVTKNLLKGGAKTRYKPQDPRAGKYKRSQQTMDRLIHNNTLHYK